MLCVQWGFLFFEKSLIYVVCRPLTKTKMGLFLSLSPFLLPLSLSLRYLFSFPFFFFKLNSKGYALAWLQLAASIPRKV